MRKSAYRQKSMFWKPLVTNHGWKASVSTASVTTPVADTVEATASIKTNTHPLVNDYQNKKLHAYESNTKDSFDQIEATLNDILANKARQYFSQWANQTLSEKLGVCLDTQSWDDAIAHKMDSGFRDLFAKTLFAQFMQLSNDFFTQDPLKGRAIEQAQLLFKEAGFHAVGIAPCADGRLTHLMSYVLRLPYAIARRKAHAGALFDISESVRNWVFVEHTRFRDGIPNAASEPTRYLKIAVYHFSKADPSHQGCAAHGSDDAKAAEAALGRLKDFKQAIENRFGCGSTVQTLLLGLNTDDDSLKVHVPNVNGDVCLKRFVQTDQLYAQTLNMTATQAENFIADSVNRCNQGQGSTAPSAGINKLLSWLIGNNFSQLAYVKHYEKGCYADIGHAERFIGVGDEFEEVQLRNLSYIGFMDTVEEGAADVDVGINIFKKLNVQRGLPIPVIIRSQYDGRVPGSKTRAVAKARRIEVAIRHRFKDLSDTGWLHTLMTLRDKTRNNAAEVVWDEN